MIHRRRFAGPLIAVIGFAALLAGRARAGEPDLTSPGTRDLTFQVGEAERTFRLHIPAAKAAAQDGTAAAAPRPLIIALHGAASSGKQTETLTGLSDLADRKNFVVAYPDGQNHVWRYWNIGGGKKDFQFISDLMDALVKAGTADRAKPKRAVPVCYWHGTEDKIVGYDGTSVEKWTFAGTTPVEFYKVTGGGHTWPGMPIGEALLGKSTQDVKASEVIWEFFSKHALPEESGK